MDIELALRREERNHRDGLPAQRRDVADLLLAAADEIEVLRKTLNQSLGIIVEFGNLNGFRNMSNAELGKAVVGMAERIAEVLPSDPVK